MVCGSHLLTSVVLLRSELATHKFHLLTESMGLICTCLHSDWVPFFWPQACFDWHELILHQSDLLKIELLTGQCEILFGMNHLLFLHKHWVVDWQDTCVTLMNHPSILPLINFFPVCNPKFLFDRSKEFFSQISVLNNAIKACIEEMEHHKGKLSKGSTKCCAFHRNILSLNCWMLLPLSYFICPFAEAGLVIFRSGKKVAFLPLVFHGFNFPLWILLVLDW